MAPYPSSATAPRLPVWRGNFQLAAAIERGIALQASAGTQIAGMYLRAHGVALETSYRILIKGIRRQGNLHQPRHYLSPPPLLYRHTHAGPVELRRKTGVNPGGSAGWPLRAGWQG